MAQPFPERRKHDRYRENWEIRHLVENLDRGSHVTTCGQIDDLGSDTD